MEKKYLPTWWCGYYGILVFDADGWDSGEWDIPITRTEFEQRVGISTIMVVDQDRYKESWSTV
jgi:hypothetical protein